MINTNGRLFTFGCSMTQYNWPTWADIVGAKFKHFENWGEPGSGNHFIFNSIIECDIKNNLTPDDTVAIMWTAPARHDYFSNNRWGHARHVFNTDNEIAHCPDGYWLTTFSYIYAVDQILKNRRIPYRMSSWTDYSSLDSKFHSNYQDLISKIQVINLSRRPYRVANISDIDNLTKLLYNALAGPDWPSLDSIKKNQYSTTPEIQEEIDNFWNQLKNDKRVSITTETEVDNHPLPGEHLKIAKTIFPELDLGEDATQWAQSLDDDLISGQHINFDKKLPRRIYDLVD